MNVLTSPVDSPPVSSSITLESYLPVKATALCSGYSAQYLRRLLREGKLDGVKVGQVWLVSVSSLEMYLRRAQAAEDQRFGPHVY